MVYLRRSASFLFSVTIALIASWLAADVFLADGFDPVDVVRVLLLATTSAWIAWGASLAIQGAAGPAPGNPGREDKAPLKSGKIAVLVPVYNEDPVAVLSRVMAMARSIDSLGEAARFEFVILSDTRNEEIATREVHRFLQMKREGPRDVQFFYRRRDLNTGKKAGNIADFLRSSGGRYDFLIILDADSLIEGETMIEMTRRMEAEPKLGLLQSLPKIIHARSWFGRAVQFSSSFHSPCFARGLAAMQGSTGPFWGHNAIVRTQAFAECCGLPALEGKPPFGGHVLSHDYVEAAMLARRGWTVRVDPDLEGSYEEGPDNIIDFAKRDRRWCQGNLQHARLLSAPGLKAWSRFIFAQGIMAYLASPLWLLFLVASIVAPVMAPPPNYFPVPHMPAIFPTPETAQAVTLLVGIFGLLIGPKLLIALRAALSRETASFGGTAAVMISSAFEIVWSSILAPITLMFQSRSVLQVLRGADGGWPASNRDADAIGMREAWAASWWIMCTGLVLLVGSAQFEPNLFYWFLPITMPLIGAPAIINWSSTRESGKLAAESGVFLTPSELSPSPVIRDYEANRLRWQTAHAADTPDTATEPVAGVANAGQVAV